MQRAMHKVGRDFRAFMAARSRYTEDHLAEAVANGVAQYVVLGAGLDTFAGAIPSRRFTSSRWIFPPRRSGNARCWTKQESSARTNRLPLD